MDLLWASAWLSKFIASMPENQAGPTPAFSDIGRSAERKPHFGSEYAVHPKWSAPERWYIRHLGVVDLPSRLRARSILQVISELCGNTFLDLGSGTGNLSFYLSRSECNRIWSVDVDGQRIRDCQGAAKLLSRRNLEFVTLPDSGGLDAFGANVFDIVLAVEVLQYVADISRSLGDILRVMKPDGFLVAHVPVLGHLRPAEQNLFDDQSLTCLLVDAGFEIESVIRTFGANIRRLCRIFEWVASHRIIIAAIFPILLAISQIFRTQSSDGNYRLVVARKPLNHDTA